MRLEAPHLNADGVASAIAAEKQATNAKVTACGDEPQHCDRVENYTGGCAEQEESAEWELHRSGLISKKSGGRMAPKTRHRRRFAFPVPRRRLQANSCSTGLNDRTQPIRVAFFKHHNRLFSSMLVDFPHHGSRREGQ
jgi:hypothetical protein